jgi:hypothetical protein
VRHVHIRHELQDRTARNSTELVDEIVDRSLHRRARDVVGLVGKRGGGNCRFQQCGSVVPGQVDVRSFRSLEPLGKGVLERLRQRPISHLDRMPVVVSRHPDPGSVPRTGQDALLDERAKRPAEGFPGGLSDAHFVGRCQRERRRKWTLLVSPLGAGISHVGSSRPKRSRGCGVRGCRSALCRDLAPR